MVQDTSALRICPACTLEKIVDDFGICRSRPDGRNLYCKACNRAKVTAARQVLRERKQERKAARADVVVVQPPITKAQLTKEQEIARLVYYAIEAGAHTRREIRSRTGLNLERVGDGLADLLIARAKPLIRLERQGETPRFFTAYQRGEADFTDKQCA